MTSYDCYCNYDAPTFYERTDVRSARKAHRCEECSRRIEVGEPYTRAAGLWDGCFSVFKTCQHCQKLRDYLTISFKCYCWAHGDSFDELRDFLDDAKYRAKEEMAGVSFRVGRLLVERKRACTAAGFNV